MRSRVAITIAKIERKPSGQEIVQLTYHLHRDQYRLAFLLQDLYSEGQPDARCSRLTTIHLEIPEDDVITHGSHAPPWLIHMSPLPGQDEGKIDHQTKCVVLDRCSHNRGDSRQIRYSVLQS